MENFSRLQSSGLKFHEILAELQFSEWSRGYVQYDQLKPLVARVGWIKKEKDEAKTMDVRKSSLADAEEALWLSVEQQIEKAGGYYESLITSLEQQHESVVYEMLQVKGLQEFLITHEFYAPSHMPLSDIGERVVDGFYGPLTHSALNAYLASGATDTPPDASPHSLDVVADFCSTLERVQEFVLINYVTLSKVLKYYIKRAGSDSDFEERLRLKLPASVLYTTPGLLDLMYKAEALVAGDVSIGKARVMEGDAWIESRLAHSRIMALARQAAVEVAIPPLPLLNLGKDHEQSSRELEPLSPASKTPQSRQDLERAKRNVLTRAMDDFVSSPAAKEASIRRQQLVSSVSLRWGEGEQGPKIFKVALTGGPCAGKTSSLSAISDYFKGLGWRVYVIREAATVMLSGGINFAFMNGEQIFELQRSIVNLMMCLEDSYEAICAKGAPNENCLLICDRGIMDASVYCDTATWQRVMESVGLDSVSACDARYTGVVHLVTAADGAEEHYNLDSNAEGVRNETAEQARELDQKTGGAWASHPSLSVIDNSTDFNTKIKRGLAATCGFVGEQAPNFALRRRKYLVSSANLRSAGLHVKTSDCDYTYLISSDNKQHRLRRRVADGTFLYTHIRRFVNEDGSTLDLKSNIDRTRYLSMLSYQDPERMLIRVVRETFVYKNRQFCLNHVLGMAPQIPSSATRRSPRGIGNVMLLTMYCEDDIDVDLPPPAVLVIEKEVTGLVEYSLYSFSKAEEGVTSAPNSPLKRARAPPASSNEAIAAAPLEL